MRLRWSPIAAVAGVLCCACCACSFLTTASGLSGASESIGDAAAESGSSIDAGDGASVDSPTRSGRVFASGQAQPSGIATDGAYVYWTNAVSGGAVMRCAESGCDPAPTVLVGGLNMPGPIIAPGPVYWSTLGDNTVWTLVGVDGGFAPNAMCYAAVFTASPTSLAPVTGGVVWANESGFDVNGCWRGDNGMNVAAGQSAPHAVVTDTRAYWAASDAIYAQGIGTACGGGNPACAALVSGVHVHAIALDVLDLYWADEVGGAIYAIPKTGADKPRLVATGQDHPWHLALDGANVYWTNLGSGTGNDGSVMRAPKAGGAPVVIADNLAQPWDIAVGTTAIFWTVRGDGTVMMAAR